MNNIVTFSLLVIILISSFQLVDSIQIFIKKNKKYPNKILRFGIIRIGTIFLAITSFAYLIGLTNGIINSILILSLILIIIFVLFIKMMYKKQY